MDTRFLKPLFHTAPSQPLATNLLTYTSKYPSATPSHWNHCHSCLDRITCYQNSSLTMYCTLYIVNNLFFIWWSVLKEAELLVKFFTVFQSAWNILYYSTKVVHDLVPSDSSIFLSFSLTTMPASLKLLGQKFRLCLPWGSLHLLQPLPKHLFIWLSSWHLSGFGSNISTFKNPSLQMKIHGECETQKKPQLRQNRARVEPHSFKFLFAPRFHSLYQLTFHKHFSSHG